MCDIDDTIPIHTSGAMLGVKRTLSWIWFNFISFESILVDYRVEINILHKSCYGCDGISHKSVPMKWSNVQVGLQNNPQEIKLRQKREQLQNRRIQMLMDRVPIRLKEKENHMKETKSSKHR